MLQLEFYLQNIHFAIQIFVAFIFFAVSWLYFDAWITRPLVKDSFKFIGFLLLSLSHLAHATFVEEVVSSSFFASDITHLIGIILRLVGYLLLIIGLYLDPLEKVPQIKPDLKIAAIAVFVLPIGWGFETVVPFFFPVLCSIVGLLYLRRATIGLENHLKRVALAFFILAFSEILSLGRAFQNSDSIIISNLVASFGILWIIEHSTLVVGIFILRSWVFRYLLKRIQTQLFMTFTIAILLIFLVTTVTFTSLLLKNLQDDALASLETNARVLKYAIVSKQKEVLADAEVIVQNPEIKTAVIEKNKKKLIDLATTTLLTKKQSSLFIVDKDAKILMRGEDTEKVDISIASDSLVKRVLADEKVSSLLIQEGVVAPDMFIIAAVPIKNEQSVVGAVVISTKIDNAFVDGLKSATQLDASIYAGNIRSATTFIAPDGKSRWIGIKEEHPIIKENVLDKAKEYNGAVTILNIPYLASFSPLLDSDSNPIGMVSLAREQTSVLQAAGKSIEITFITTILLLILSILPAYLVARSIAKQLR